MKVARIVLAVWMCLVFALAGTQGAILCIKECLRISLHPTHDDGMCADDSAQNPEEHQDHKAPGRSCPTAEKCCYTCVDIPLPGGDIPECTAQQPTVTKISKVRLATCLNATLLSHSNQSAASAFVSSRPVMGTATRSDRTIVLRI
jgi:hypothetical protein